MCVCGIHILAKLHQQYVFVFVITFHNIDQPYLEFVVVTIRKYSSSKSNLFSKIRLWKTIPWKYWKYWIIMMKFMHTQEPNKNHNFFLSHNRLYVNKQSRWPWEYAITCTRVHNTAGSLNRHVRIFCIHACTNHMRRCQRGFGAKAPFSNPQNAPQEMREPPVPNTYCIHLTVAS